MVLHVYAVISIQMRKGIYCQMYFEFSNIRLDVIYQTRETVFHLPWIMKSTSIYSVFKILFILQEYFRNQNFPDETG